MKKIGFLIREVRRRANVLDPKAMSNIEVANYFNDLQQQIFHFISRTGNNVGLLQKSYKIALVSGKNAYDLPEDIQLCSATNAVYSERGSIIPQRNESEKGPGYFLRAGKIVFNKQIEAREVEIVYESKLNKVSCDIAIVDSVSLAPNKIKLSTVMEEKFYLEDDTITVETTNGVKNFTIVSYDPINKEITVDEDPSDVVIGSKILLGHNAVSTMALPEEVVPYMLRAIETYIRHRRNNTKFNVSLTLAQDEFSNLADMLAKPGTGVSYPVVLDTDYLE